MPNLDDLPILDGGKCNTEPSKKNCYSVTTDHLQMVNRRRPNAPKTKNIPKGIRRISPLVRDRTLSQSSSLSHDNSMSYPPPRSIRGSGKVYIAEQENKSY